jgi:hypothetical protein
MYTQIAERCIAFEGSRCIARGEIRDVVREVKAFVDEDPNASILVFDEETARIVEMDYRGTAEQVFSRVEELRVGVEKTASTHEPQQAHTFNFGSIQNEKTDGPEEMHKVHRGPGRPKLGVVSREVTLLPRHWEWLASQPGSASVTLRKLVDEARKRNEGKDRIRRAQEITYRFMNAMAGDFPGFEEALRALYAADRERFTTLTESWSGDVRDFTRELASEAFSEGNG